MTTGSGIRPKVKVAKQKQSNLCCLFSNEFILAYIIPDIFLFSQLNISGS